MRGDRSDACDFSYCLSPVLPQSRSSVRGAVSDAARDRLAREPFGQPYHVLVTAAADQSPEFL
jgi:hypothetical protein